MPSINISEADFMTVAGAALEAKKRGEMDDARALDKIARKINAALTNSNPHLEVLRRMSGMPRPPGPSWRDMPSTIDVIVTDLDAPADAGETGGADDEEFARMLDDGDMPGGFP